MAGAQKWHNGRPARGARSVSARRMLTASPSNGRWRSRVARPAGKRRRRTAGLGAAPAPRPLRSPRGSPFPPPLPLACPLSGPFPRPPPAASPSRRPSLCPPRYPPPFPLALRAPPSKTWDPVNPPVTMATTTLGSVCRGAGAGVQLWLPGRGPWALGSVPAGTPGAGDPPSPRHLLKVRLPTPDRTWGSPRSGSPSARVPTAPPRDEPATRPCSALTPPSKA